MKKFWNWQNVVNEAGEPERELIIDGAIADEGWYDDDVTPDLFRAELSAGNGPVTVWINSPGGDCFAASQIYTMLRNYAGEVTVKVDGIAASAASVIAMAGTKVLMAPTAMLMIHNPATLAIGDRAEMQKAIEMLDEVKESIINAYEAKTGIQRAKLARLMDAETWMNARKAIEFNFADGILEARNTADASFAFEARTSAENILKKAVAKIKPERKNKPTVNDLLRDLENKKH